MLPPRTTVAALATALALSLTACGGGDDDTLNRKDLISKANAICKELEPKLVAIKQPNTRDAKTYAAYVDKIVPLTDELASRLKGLKPEDDLKSDWDAVTTAITTTSSAFKNFTAKIKANDRQGTAAAAQELQRVGDGPANAFKKFGLTGCNS